MHFTYDGYLELLSSLRLHGYMFTDYDGWRQFERCVILRHDIDISLEKAVQMAEIENSWGIASTYFVLVTSDLYNVFSKKSIDALRQIIKCGHAVGLHFDEAQYPGIEKDMGAVCKKILYEADLLEAAVGQEIRTVSMHRPSREILEVDLRIPRMINSYGKEYFKDFKYLSDSRRRWREPVETIIASGQYSRLHILTHAFWYNEVEMDSHDTIAEFVNHGCSYRYSCLQSNITSLHDIMKPDEIFHGGELV